MKRFSLILILFYCQCFASEGFANENNVKPPPRSIGDILAVINQAKPDLSLQEKAKKIIEETIPQDADRDKKNIFYFKRAKAYEILGDDKSAVDSMKIAVENFPNSQPQFINDDLNYYALLESARGNAYLSNQILEKIQDASGGWLLNILRLKGSNCLVLGNFECARAQMNDIKNIVGDPAYKLARGGLARLNWQAGYEALSTKLLLQEGKYQEAETSGKKAITYLEPLIAASSNKTMDVLDLEYRATEQIAFSSRPYIYRLINVRLDMARSYLGQKRLIEAELQARDALNLSISKVGVDSGYVSSSLITLSDIISEQGRNQEAVLLANAALDSLIKAGVPQWSIKLAEVRETLAGALIANGRYSESEKIFVERSIGIKSDPDLASKFKTETIDWVLVSIKNGNFKAALKMSELMLRNSENLDSKSSSPSALNQAFYASALMADGSQAKALEVFTKSMPILIEEQRLNSENNSTSTKNLQRMNFLFENYLLVLSQTIKSNASSNDSLLSESFLIGDLVRGSMVQKFMNASSARANIQDAALANLARNEQDLQQQIVALSSLLVDLLAQSPSQQSPASILKTRSDLIILRNQRENLKKEIQQRFPDYAELIDPKPASITRLQKVLKPDEVMVSWYFGDNVGYVWAITKDKPAQFAQLSIGRAQIAKEVSQLRKSLDPGVATIDEIPPFDVALANQLYQQVLAPVQGSFVGKKVMLTVPHAELGQLPLSLLVTKSTAQPTKGGPTAFIGYKTVPWLTRDIAVAQVPSVTSLAALRSLPVGNPNRKNFIGFGDPYFSSEQEKSAQKQAKATQLATRGIPLSLRSAPKTSGVSSAELALLPRLPDTSLELEEIGKAIGAGDGDIFLHQQASVKQVLSTDLSNRKVVMFATHGLVPGELNGLTQPALALSSPDVTGDKDDGLLTMDKVLTLKLDADWVVLSACNTASGESAGSEAVSGLGRAFFFAGAKALLVSNWPVDSVASRTMMTDLFKNQQKEQGTSKAELLRKAMLNQIDQGGMKEGGNMKYAYAHPLFWAPFVVVGD